MAQLLEFRKDTSFPYLKIAERHGLPYAVVLDISERLNGGRLVTAKVDYLKVPFQVFVEVARANTVERQRRGNLTTLKNRA